jgi:ADP-heptose:LPS heptosyltransferase
MINVIIFRKSLKVHFVYLIQRFLGYLLCINRKIRKSNKVRKNSIVIFSFHKLGDAVFTIPAISQIQKYYQSKITIFCFKELAAIYKIVFKNIDFCTVEHSDFYFRGRIARRSTRTKLARLNPKIIVDLTGAITSASFLINARATNIIGMNKEYFKSLYDSFTPIFYKSHLKDIYLNVSNLLINSETNLQNHDIITTPKSIESILIHPFAGWKAKEWNLYKFIKLAQELSKTHKISFLVPSNSLKKDVEEEIKSCKIDLVKTKSVEELIAALKNCSLLIGNDSGPIHIASILGKATFTIYGPTNPQFSLPNSSHHGYYQKMIKCSPISTENMCYTDGGRIGCPAFECMNQLSVEEVYESIRSFINDLESKSIA